MHQHVNDLAKLINDVAHRVSIDPSTLPQARAVIYAARTMIYARGQEARFKNRTPYFTVAAHDAATTKTSAVKSKRKPKDSNDFMPI